MKTNKKSAKTVVNYPAGDFLIRIKNAVMAKRKTVEFPSYKFINSIAKAIQKEGFLREVKVENGILKAAISYRKKEPLITNIKLISKPGLRIYMSVDELEKIKTPSIFILSTPKGVVSSKDALKRKLGGEVIVEIL